MQKNRLENLINTSLPLRSMKTDEEKIACLEKLDTFLTALLIKKSNPDLLSEPEQLIIDRIKKQLSVNDREVLVDIFMAKYTPFDCEPPEHSLEEVQMLYDDGLYFTEKEIMEIIQWENTKPKEDINHDVINFVTNALSRGLFFKTSAEAEEAMEKYEERRRNELGGGVYD